MVIDTYGKFWEDNSPVIICPNCERKRKVLNEFGDLRGVVHCRCKTGKRQTVFTFEMGGIYLYIDKEGNHIIL